MLSAAVTRTSSIVARTALSDAAVAVEELASRLLARLLADARLLSSAAVSFAACSAALSEAVALVAKLSIDDASANTGNGGGGGGLGG
jgi:hypothetical protein